MARIPDRFGNVLNLPSLEEPISVGLFAFGVYEPDTLRAVLRDLRPSGPFLDVGASVGVLALPAAACRPDARIICIEADPQIVSLLRSNVTANGGSNITVIHCLAGPITDRHVSFYRAPSAKFGMDPPVPNSAPRPLLWRNASWMIY
jgi:hypothetical protein